MKAIERILYVYSIINSYVNIGILIGVVGVCLALASWFWPRIGKVPIYGIKNFNLINRKKADLKKFKVEFQGRALDALTISKIVFLNKGRIAIRKNDFSTADPFRIEIEQGFEILDTELLSSTGSAINCQIIRIDATATQITFDHLNSGDGVVLRVSHTGDSGDALRVCGSFIDAKPLRKWKFTTFKGIDNIKRWTGGNVNHRMVRYIMSAVMILLPLFAAYSILNTGSEFNAPAAFAGVAMIALYWGLAVNILRTDLPSSLEIYFED